MVSMSYFFKKETAVQIRISSSCPILFKVDLLPKETDLNCIGDWVVEATVKKKLK